MISRNFSKLSNEDIAGFISEPEGAADINDKVTRAILSSTDLWILTNMKSSTK